MNIDICVEAPCTEIILEDVEYYPPYSRPDTQTARGRAVDASPGSGIPMRDALGVTSRAAYVTRHTSPISFCQIWQGSTVYFCIFMGRMCMHESCMRCMVVSHPPAGAPGSTVRVEVLRLPPLTLFALGDNQSSAGARTHHLQLCIPSYASDPRVRSWT